MARIDVAGSLRLTQHLFDGAAPGLEHRSDFFPHARKFLGHFAGKKPQHTASFEAQLCQSSGEKREMISQTLQRSHAFLEQKVYPGALDVAPESVDREVFLVFEMIEKGTLGNTGSFRDVLD